MIALIQLAQLAVVALVAKARVPDIFGLLAAVSRANVEAFLASSVLARDAARASSSLRPSTAGEIEAAALALVGDGCRPEAVVAALAREALGAVDTLGAACGHHLTRAGWSLERLVGVVESVERAASSAPAGVDASSIPYGIWTGPKYAKGRTAAEVAKLLRADLAMLHVDPRSPICGVSTKVRAPSATSIIIEAAWVPDGAPLLNRARVEQDKGLRAASPVEPILSGRGAALVDAARKAAHAYTYLSLDGFGLSVTARILDALLAAERTQIAESIGV